MKDYLIDIWIVLSIVVAINSIIFLTKLKNKFWKTSILIWVFFLASMAIIIPVQNKQVSHLENEYWESAEGKSYGDREIWKELRTSRELSVKTRMTLLHLVGLQTIMTFILQIMGYTKTEEKKVYKWTASIFGWLSLIYLIFQFMVEIVPTGPFF